MLTGGDERPGGGEQLQGFSKFKRATAGWDVWRRYLRLCLVKECTLQFAPQYCVDVGVVLCCGG